MANRKLNEQRQCNARLRKQEIERGVLRCPQPNPVLPKKSLLDVKADEWVEEHGIRPLPEAVQRLERALWPGHGGVSVLDQTDLQALAYVLRDVRKKLIAQPTE